MIHELEYCMFAEPININNKMQGYFSRMDANNLRIKNNRMFLDGITNIIWMIDVDHLNELQAIKTTSMSNCKENKIFLDGAEFKDSTDLIAWFKREFLKEKADVGNNDIRSSKASAAGTKPAKKALHT